MIKFIALHRKEFLALKGDAWMPGNIFLYSKRDIKPDHSVLSSWLKYCSHLRLSTLSGGHSPLAFLWLSLIKTWILKALILESRYLYLSWELLLSWFRKDARIFSSSCSFVTCFIVLIGLVLIQIQQLAIYSIFPQHRYLRRQSLECT